MCDLLNTLLLAVSLKNEQCSRDRCSKHNIRSNNVDEKNLLQKSGDMAFGSSLFEVQALYIYLRKYLHK